VAVVPPTSPDEEPVTDEEQLARRNPRRFVIPDLGAHEFGLEILSSIILMLSGGSLWLLWRNNSFVQSLAANLVAAGLVGLLVFSTYGWLARRRANNEAARHRQLLERIAQSLLDGDDVEKRDGRLLDLVREGLREGFTEVSPVFDSAFRVGLTEVYEYRPTSQINQEVIQARNVVHILEISLHSMREISASDWVRCRAEDLRIIVLDPLFPTTRPLAAQRDLEESRQHGTILEEIHDLLYRLPADWFPADRNPRVKLARTMPTLSYFRIDDVAYFSPLVHNKVGDATLHLRLSRGGQLFQVLERHFEALWSDDKRAIKAVPAEMPRTYGERAGLTRSHG